MGLRFTLDNGEEFILDARQVAQIQSDVPRRINIAEARRYADLVSVWADLDIAVTVLDRLIAIQQSEDRDQDGVLEHSYWITAVVHYARCFAEGKRRTGLSHRLVKEKAPEYVVLHNWMRNLRNKHVAHDENPYQNFVGSVVLQRAPTGHVLAVPNIAARGMIGVDAERAKAVRALIIRVGDVVKEQLERARSDFTAALAKLTFAHLEALPAIDLPIPNIEDAGRNRHE
jgi:hypothetical protein